MEGSQLRSASAAVPRGDDTQEGRGETVSHFMQNFEKRNLTGTCRLLTCAGHWPERGEHGGLEIRLPRPGWGPGAEQGAVCTDIWGTAAKEWRQDALAGPGAAEETSPLLAKHMEGSENSRPSGKGQGRTSICCPPEGVAAGS